jgi:hypothetical protein
MLILNNQHGFFAKRGFKYIVKDYLMIAGAG